MRLMEKKYAPYPPAQNLTHAIRTFRERGYSGKVDVEVLTSIGIPEGNAYRVLAALKWLGIVGSDGMTTDLMEAIRRASQEEYPTLIEGMVRSSYDEIFKYCDPATADVSRIDDAFRSFHPPVQRAKMVTAFLALCKEAGIISADVAERSPTAKAARKVQTVQRKQTTRGSGVVQPPPAAPPPAPARNGRLHPAVQAWIDEMPASGEPWDRGDFENWLAIFRASVERAYKI